MHFDHVRNMLHVLSAMFVNLPQVSPHGAVACDVKQCSDIGTDILKKGGSAVDAAIATAFCVGLVNPQHSGIGG